MLLAAGRDRRLWPPINGWEVSNEAINIAGPEGGANSKADDIFAHSYTEVGIGPRASVLKKI